MASPLSIYQETADKFGITGEKRLAVDAQLAHIQTQLQEMRIIVNRSLVDVVGLHINRDNAKDEMSKSAYSDGISKHQAEIHQYSMKMDALIQLQKELEA